MTNPKSYSPLHFLAGGMTLNEAVSGVVTCLVDEDEAHVRKSAVNALAHWLAAASGRCFCGRLSTLFWYIGEIE